MDECLLLFDIDGTLIDAGGAGVEAIRLAVQDLYGDEIAVPELDVRGTTDAALAQKLLPAMGAEVSPANIAQLYEAYLIRLREQFQNVSPEAGILPGVHELLNTLKKEGVVMGLLTGNLEAGAWIKLESFGLDHYFSFGAFGDEHPERDKLGPEALAEAERVHQRRFNPMASVVIGDTPRDISCGRVIGASTVAVATGAYALEELSEHAPTLALRSLKESEVILDLVSKLSGGRALDSEVRDESA
ncbi:MAG TPA: hydrolase [Verrucomicrobiales bacterium]|nr:hydrolase [Euryarchaeota archaeon]HAO96239.1 hydrolase [Verrucomicrobiales bacterium]|tara:strand:- start:473 stop:1207 length:735 start_codon:yes stop_codon:yes gene_type:complete